MIDTTTSLSAPPIVDDEPLTSLATKVPKKEKEVDLLDFLDKPTAKKSTAEKRKATTPAKSKATPVKKAKVVKEAKASASKDKVVEKKKKGRFQRLFDAATHRELHWNTFSFHQD